MSKKRRGGALEYWVRAITAARIHGEDLAIRLRDKWEKLSRLLEENLKRAAPFDGKIYKLQYTSNTSSGPLANAYNQASNTVFYGVDSSIVKPVRVGVKYVTFLSGAAVRLDPGNPRKAAIIHLEVDPDDVPEAGDLSEYKQELTLKMFEKELRAIRQARKDLSHQQSSKALVLDGPLIDPPILTSRKWTSKKLADKAEALAQERAKHLALAYRDGARVVGYVKRLHGSIFLNEYLGESAERLRGEVGDRLLVLALAKIFVEKAEEYGICSAGDKVVIVSKPIEANPKYAGDAPVYNDVIMNVVGGRIYTSLVIPLYCDGNRRRPARIEFIARPGEEEKAAAEIAATLEAVATPGTYLPLPVAVAHNSCTIRSRVGRKLLKELISRHVVLTIQEKAPTLLDLFGG